MQAVSARLQAPLRQRGDQIDLTCGEPTAQDPPQTRFGKIPLPFGHGLPVVRREQDVLTLLCDNEYLHYKHRSDSCPTALGKTMAAELVAGTSQLLLMPFNAQRSEQLRTSIAG